MRITPRDASAADFATATKAGRLSTHWARGYIRKMQVTMATHGFGEVKVMVIDH